MSAGKCLAVWILCFGSVVGQVKPKYMPLRIPGKHKFPVSEAALLQMRDDQNDIETREHAWNLFAGLTRPAGSVAVWQTWYNKCDVHLALAQCPTRDNSAQNHMIRSLELSPQSLLEFRQLIGQTPPTALTDLSEKTQILQTFFSDYLDHPELASVWFNRPAANHILDSLLYESNVLNGIYCKRRMSHSFKSEQEVPPFPVGSVVLKMGWELVRLDKGDLTTPLSLWNPDKLAELQAKPGPGLSNSIDWGKVVRINTRAGLCEDKDYDAIVPLDCFFAFPVDKKWACSDLVQRVGPIVSCPMTVGKYFLVLVAIHVITKEIPDWVWATFWWHNHRNDTVYAAGRPDSTVLRGNKWRHFLMNTALSRVTPLEPPPKSGPKLCFNPFLEETQFNGVVSNCIQCHRRAAYNPETDKITEGKDLGLTWRDGKTPANGTQPNPHYFDDALRTDYIWSISTAQDTELRDFVMQLNTFLQTMSSH
jgi:hypothetical protein